MAQEILCSVDSCYYNSGGSVCKASKIMVRNSSTGGNTRFEIGTIGGEAKTSNQTSCETFIPRDKGPKPGIERLS